MVKERLEDKDCRGGRVRMGGKMGNMEIKKRKNILKKGSKNKNSRQKMRGKK